MSRLLAFFLNVSASINPPIEAKGVAWSLPLCIVFRVRPDADDARTLPMLPITWGTSGTKSTRAMQVVGQTSEQNAPLTETSSKK